MKKHKITELIYSQPFHLSGTTDTGRELWIKFRAGRLTILIEEDDNLPEEILLYKEYLGPDEKNSFYWDFKAAWKLVKPVLENYFTSVPDPKIL